MLIFSLMLIVVVLCAHMKKNELNFRTFPEQVLYRKAIIFRFIHLEFSFFIYSKLKLSSAF